MKTLYEAQKTQAFFCRKLPTHMNSLHECYTIYGKAFKGLGLAAQLFSNPSVRLRVALSVGVRQDKTVYYK